MYYPKFKEWGVLKHDKAEEKDDLCNKLLKLHQQGDKMPHLSANKLNKLQRRYREKLSAGQAAEELGDLLHALQRQSFFPSGSRNRRTEPHGHIAASEYSEDSDKSLGHIDRSPSPSSSEEGSGDKVTSNYASSSEEAPEEFYEGTIVSSIAKPCLSPSKENAELEGLLILTRAHYQASLDQYLQLEANNNMILDNVSISSVPSLLTNKVFWSKIKSAIYFLKTGPEESERLAWPLLSEAGDMVPSLCYQQPFSLIKDLFATLSPLNMSIYPACRATVLGLFTNSTPDHFRQNHPFFLICLRLAENEKLSEESSVIALQLLTKLSNHSLPAGHVELFELKRTLIRLLRRQGNLSDAERLNKALIKTTENDRGKSHVQSRLAMTELVYILNDQRRYVESLGLAERIVKRGEQAQSGGLPDERTVYAMEDAAEICDRLGRIEDSISWLRRALRGALNLWASKEATTHINDKLEILYGRVGRVLPGHSTKKPRNA